ncbi:MAG: tetratricopeptide repeat protein [Candidatus Brocadiia bacterium]
MDGRGLVSCSFRSLRILFSLVVLALSVFGMAGCEKETDKEKKSAQEKVIFWKGKYDDIVQKNEKAYDDIKNLKTQNAELKERVDALEEKVQEQAGAAEIREELKATKEKIGDKDEQIEQLQDKVLELQKDLKEMEAEEAGSASAEALKNLETKTAATRKDLAKVGEKLFREERNAEARSVLESAVALGLEDPESLFQLGYVSAEEGEYEAAARWYMKSAAKAREKPEEFAELLPKVTNNCGVVLAKSGKVEEALKWYKRSVDYNDKYAPVCFNLARSYQEHLDEPRKAIEFYRRHIALRGRQSIAAEEAIAKLQKSLESEGN